MLEKIAAFGTSVPSGMNNVTKVVNNERKNASDRGIANQVGEREYVIYDKELINSILIAQLELLETVQDKKHVDKNGNVKDDYLRKLKKMKRNAIAYSSNSTIELLGYMTNPNYFMNFCKLDESDRLVAITILGSLVLLSMKHDINPYAELKFKPILLSLVNDYDDEKENNFKRIFDVIKKKLKLDFKYL